MSYFLSVSYYPRSSSGSIVTVRRSFLRLYTDFGAVKRKLRYFKRHAYVLSYYVEERPVKV